MLYIEPSEIKKDNAELETLAIVTRSSRSASYLNRVLEGLIYQSGAHLIWSIVTQTQMSPEHETKQLLLTSSCSMMMMTSYVQISSH